MTGPMKTLILQLLLFAFASHAHAGFDSGNAGDAFSAEFLFSGRDVLQRLETLAEKGHALVDVKQLRAAMETTTVVSEERVFLDGLERDAVNYPSKKLIKISRARWKDLRRSNETKARLTLVLHEFLWVSGIDDTNFAKSGPIIERLNVPPYSPSIWLNVPGLAFATAECTGSLNDGTFVTVVVSTEGATKAPSRGEVKIERAGNKFGYRFSAEEISQFFEVDEAETNTAMVGLSAFVSREYPISVRYSGPNYVDMDLRAVLTSGSASRAQAGTSRDQAAHGPRNRMRVWKGPGHEAKDQYVLTNPVCSVWSNN